MKKAYKAPGIELLLFGCEDIITTSDTEIDSEKDDSTTGLNPGGSDPSDEGYTGYH